MSGKFMKSIVALACQLWLFAGGAAAEAISVEDADVDADTVAVAPNFDNESIRRLFGERVATDTITTDTARVLQPFEGNCRLLISRPFYAAYDKEPGTAWISAIAEAYTYYKAASLPRTHVFTMEQADGALPNSRDRGRHFNWPHYTEAGRGLGATHVIYQEYLPQSCGTRAYYAITLYRLLDGEDAVEAEFADTVAYADFERGLNRLLGAAAAAIDSGAANTAAFGLPVFGNDRAFIEAFGNALAVEDAFTGERAEAALAAARRPIRENPNLIGVNYAAALLAGRAQDYDRAIGHISAVIGGPGNYPALNLRLAEYLRGAGRYAEALTAAAAAWPEPALRTPAALETAMIHKARGNHGSAREIYKTVTNGPDADGRAFFQLALLYARAGDAAESETVMELAARRGIVFLRDEYYELGAEYGKIDGCLEKALQYLEKSMGANPNDERAWRAIAELHGRAGNRELQADALVNLFMINPREHAGGIRQAGSLYEELGLPGKAREVYKLFLARRHADRDISLALARLYMEGGECGMAREILNAQNLYLDPEAAPLLSACGFRIVKLELAEQLTRRERVLRNARISAGLLTAGGVTAGLIFNGAVLSEGRKYRDHAPEAEKPRYTGAEAQSEVSKMRKNIENYTLYRNLLYGLGALGAGGFAVTFFF